MQPCAERSPARPRPLGRGCHERQGCDKATPCCRQALRPASSTRVQPRADRRKYRHRARQGDRSHPTRRAPAFAGARPVNQETASAWARLRSAMTSPSKRNKPGHTQVLKADLERLLAEVEALSNQQMARYLIKITLEELRNGDPATEGKTHRPMEGRSRRNPAVRRLHRSANDRSIAAVERPFVFGPEDGLPTHQ